MSDFHCWVPDYGHEMQDGWTFKGKAWDDIGDAVTAYCERKFSDWEYPTEIDVAVCELAQDGSPAGPVRMFNVEVESVPAFHVYERATPTPTTKEE